MFLDPKLLRRITIDITANCNSFCPGCLRRVASDVPRLGLKEGDINPAIQVGHKGNMPLSTVKNIFTPTVMGGLKTLDFNGTFGDCIMHPDLIPILHHIADVSDSQKEQRKANDRNRRTDLWISTNGGVRDKVFWTELGKLASERYNPNNSEVIFALEGTDDKTHQMYRRKVPYEAVLERAQWFMDAGGTAVWQIIEFEHNKHQIPDARKLAEEYGFSRFDIRRSRMAEHISNSLREEAIRTGVMTVAEKETSYEHSGFSKVKKKDMSEGAEHSHTTEAYKEMEVKAKKIVVEKFNDNMDDYANNCSIWCQWGNEGKLQIEWDGRVHVCCHMTAYFGRPWNKDSANEQGQPDNEYQNYYVNKYDDNWNYTSHHTLEDILHHKFYQKDLHDSWKNKVDDPEKPRLNICIDNCGSIATELRSEKEERIILGE